MGMYDRKSPYMLPEEPKTQAVCTCGNRKCTFCDGSHQNGGARNYTDGKVRPLLSVLGNQVADRIDGSCSK